MRSGFEPRLDAFMDMLDEHEDQCVMQAQALAERLMDARKARRNEPDWQERGGSLALRVRGRGSKGSGSFRAEWVVMRRVTATAKDLQLARKGDPKAKYRTFYTTLPKGGRNNKYPDSRLLKHARDWEAELILEIESEVAEVRKQAKIIADLRSRTAKYIAYLLED